MTAPRISPSDLPRWIDIRRVEQPGCSALHLINIRDPADVGEAALLDVSEAETLLEALLDFCPNAETIAHNWLLERQKADYAKGGK